MKFEKGWAAEQNEEKCQNQNLAARLPEKLWNRLACRNVQIEKKLQKSNSHVQGNLESFPFVTPPA